MKILQNLNEMTIQRCVFMSDQFIGKEYLA